MQRSAGDAGRKQRCFKSPSTVATPVSARTTPESQFRCQPLLSPEIQSQHRHRPSAVGDVRMSMTRSGLACRGESERRVRRIIAERAATANAGTMTIAPRGQPRRGAQRGVVVCPPE